MSQMGKLSPELGKLSPELAAPLVLELPCKCLVLGDQVNRRGTAVGALVCGGRLRAREKVSQPACLLEDVRATSLSYQFIKSSPTSPPCRLTGLQPSVLPQSQDSVSITQQDT